ncbi:MAG TPA: hypothetical protein VFG68_21785 [Fimbriiglobus sp.]|nr:hypothetical protein [Fimbriiglobus sp.]
MPRFSPQWMIAPAVVSLIAAAWFFRPEPSAVGSDPAADPEANAVSRELQVRQDAVIARIEYKDALIDQLIAGQTTLTEVTGEFLALNRGTHILTMIRAMYSGTNDEEKSARNVLDYVRQRMLPAEQNARVFKRLNREFAQAYGHPRASAD